MTYRVAVLGLGVMGQRMMSHLAMHEDFEILGGWDAVPAARAHAKTLHPSVDFETPAEALIAAPATDLVTLMNDDINSVGGKNITAMTLWSWHRVYDAPLGNILDLAAMPTVDRLARECIEGPFDLIERVGPTAGGLPVVVLAIQQLQPFLGRRRNRVRLRQHRPRSHVAHHIEGAAELLVGGL